MNVPQCANVSHFRDHMKHIWCHIATYLPNLTRITRFKPSNPMQTHAQEMDEIKI